MSNIVSFVESISLHLGSGGTCGKTVGDRACLEDGEGFLIWHLVLKVRVLVFNDDLFFLAFRNCVGQSCAEELNQLVLRSSMGAGFTGIEICAADTTVQESPIAYPTEVGHLKNIAENILGFGKKLRLGSMETLVNFKDMAQGLFTRGKTEQALNKKKRLSKKLLSKVQKMVRLAKTNLLTKRGSLATGARKQLDLYEHMLGQFKVWMKTGFHPKEKLSACGIQQPELFPRASQGRPWSSASAGS
ncbi:MAG: hypothetical protein JNM39_09185 [Bdellovibrionaceae bacterium]|nr:hypothetical protein [Pseudobdellovibrionaceae bacterium]